MPKKLIDRKKSCVAAADDDLFYQARVSAVAGWTATTVYDLPEKLDQDRKLGTITRRQSILFCLETLAEMSEKYGYLQVLSGTAQSLSKRLKALWFDFDADQPIPYCPAFRQWAITITGNAL